MGDDFREEYTDVKNMAFPSCPQEWILFWLFPLTWSPAQKHVIGSRI